MSNTAFSTPASYNFTAQPASATRIYVRSTSADDDGVATPYGIVSGVPDASFIQLLGQDESATGLSYTSLSQFIYDDGPAIGTLTGYAFGVAAVGDVRGDTQPTDGDTLTLGSVPYRFKNTLVTSYDVKIGANIGATMTNLKKAINDDGTPGTDYGTATAANNVFSATVLTDVVTLTDIIPCARALPYTITESASNFSIRLPIGGEDGVLLFTIPAGRDYVATPLTFSTEDHATETLPALMLAVSNYVATNGEKPMLRLWSDQTIDYKIQSSTDLINWTDTTEGEETLAASTLTFVDLAQRAEYIRFCITTNANTDGTIADFRVIY